MLCDRVNVKPLDHAGYQEVKATSITFDTLSSHTSCHLKRRWLAFLALWVVFGKLKLAVVSPYVLPSLS